MPARLTDLVARIVDDSTDLQSLRSLLAMRQDASRARERLQLWALQTDPRLGERLVRLSEQLQHFDSLQDAWRREGYRPLHSALVIARLIEWWGAEARAIDGRQHWRHAVATGTIAALNAQAGDDDEDRAFPAGAAHGLPRLALDHAVPDELARAIELAKNSAMDLIDAQAIQIGFTEGDVARGLTEGLALPEWLLQGPCGGLDRPPPTRVARFVGVSCLTSRALGIPDGTGVASPVPPWAWRAVERSIRRVNVAGGRQWLQRRVEGAIAAGLLSDRP